MKFQSNNHQKKLPVSLNFLNENQRYVPFNINPYYQFTNNYINQNHNRQQFIRNQNVQGEKVFNNIQTLLNTRMLKLVNCPCDKIVVLVKNRVLKQQIIKVEKKESRQNFDRSNLIMQDHLMITKTPSKHHLQHPQKIEQQNKQYEQNEVLFNYTKIIEERKQRKKKFLENIESKLNDLQMQAQNLEINFKQSDNQLKELHAINYKTSNQINNMRINKKISKLESEIQNQLENNKKKDEKIDLIMEVKQINEKLAQTYQENQKLYEEIEAKINNNNKKEIKNQSNKDSQKLINTVEIKKNTTKPPLNNRNTSKKKLSSTLQSTLKRPQQNLK